MTKTEMLEYKKIESKLDGLVMLYKNLLDALVKTGKVLPNERKAIAKKEELISEKDLFAALKA
jgi:hypothetical protein